MAYSPLVQGFSPPKYDASNRPGGVRLTNPLFLEETLTRGRELLNTLRSVAKTHGATPAQVALAWVIRRHNVVAIPGASSVDQLVRNAEAADPDASASRRHPPGLRSRRTGSAPHGVHFSLRSFSETVWRNNAARIKEQNRSEGGDRPRSEEADAGTILRA
jgi:hypothetical protein